MYRTHGELGKALKDSKKPRDEIFITDKYSCQHEISENPVKALDAALNKIGAEYVDLFLIHTPWISREEPGFTLEEVWKQMEQLYKEGKTKSIGVSNFRTEDIERILKVAEVKPQVNQIEFNAFLQNQTPGIVKYCQKNDIQLEAYSPLAPLQREPRNSPELPFYQLISYLAQKYEKTEAQILLRWVNARHIVPVSTSSNPQRIKDAQNVFSFELTVQEVEKITQLGLEHKPLRLYMKSAYDKYNSDSQKA